MQTAGDDAPALPLARPAATVIVARPATAATGAASNVDGFEILLLERSNVGAFAGMWVFPGGRVDDADAGEDELARARSAAVREASEEVGITVDPASLITLSHWTPPLVFPKRFTTWFFVAPWAGDDVRIDEHEIVDSRWMRPEDAIADGLSMAPPTYVTLVTMAEAKTFDGVRALVARRGIEKFVTQPGDLAGQMVLMWEPDAGYATGDPTVPGARHRMTIDSGGLTGGTGHTYERS